MIKKAIQALSQKQSSRNLVASLTSFTVSVGVGILFVPYLIHHLGASAYGLVPLATILTSYMAIITMGLNSAVGRYITISVEQEDDEKANRVFNTSFFGSILLTLILLGPSFWAAMHVERLLNVPPGQVSRARLLFVCTTIAFLLNEIKTPFDVASFCRNRFDLRSATTIGETLIKTLSVVIIFRYTPANLSYVGVGILLASLFSSARAVYFWRRLTPNLHVHLSGFDLSALKELTSTGGWIIVNQIGTVLFISIDLLLVNRLFGVESAGKYAAVMQWPALLRSLAWTVQAIFTPTVMKLYAKHDIGGVVHYCRTSIRTMGLLLALPIGLICGLSQPLLSVWLGPRFVPFAPLMSLMTVHLCVNLAYHPLLNVPMATNHVRTPGLVQIVFGFFNLLLALVMAGPMHLGLYGIAGASAIVLTLKNAVFTPIYAAHVLKKPARTFMQEALPMMAVTLLITAVGQLITHFLWHSYSFRGLILVGAAMTAAYALAVYRFALSGSGGLSLRRLLKPKPDAPALDGV